MNCNEIEQQLADYLGGELEASAVEAVDAHLAACETCRREVASLGHTLDALNRLDAPVVATSTRARSRIGKLQPFAYAATLLIGLGVGWWIKSVDIQTRTTVIRTGSDDGDSPSADRDWADAVLAAYTGRSVSTPFARNTVKLVRALSASPRY